MTFEADVFDSEIFDIGIIELVLTDSFTASDAFSKLPKITLAEGVSLSDLSSKEIRRILLDSVSISDVIETNKLVAQQIWGVAGTIPAPIHAFREVRAEIPITGKIFRNVEQVYKLEGLVYRPTTFGIPLYGLVTSPVKTKEELVASIVAKGDRRKAIAALLLDEDEIASWYILSILEKEQN